MNLEKQPSLSEQITPSAVHTKAMEVLKLFGKPANDTSPYDVQKFFKALNAAPHTATLKRSPITATPLVKIQTSGKERMFQLESVDNPEYHPELSGDDKRLTLSVLDNTEEADFSWDRKERYLIEPDLITRRYDSDDSSHRRFEISDNVNGFVLNALNKMQEKLES